MSTLTKVLERNVAAIEKNADMTEEDSDWDII